FPRTFKDFSHLINDDTIILVSAKVNQREGEDIKLIADSIIPVHEDNVDEIADMLDKGMWVYDGESAAAKKVEAAPVANASNVAQFRTKRERDPHKLPSIKISLRGRPDREFISQLREVLKKDPGRSSVYMKVESAGRWRTVETDYMVQMSDLLIEELQGLVGKENIEVS
ncbi:MAG: hypothetical protein O2877_02725, partial [bacterium]|nr:hypothetical protein [bacterium]